MRCGVDRAPLDRVADGHLAPGRPRRPPATSAVARIDTSLSMVGALDRRACREGRRPRTRRDRHGVRVRAALPGAAVPGAGGGARPGGARRRAHRGARPAGRRSARPGPARARARRPRRGGRGARRPPGHRDPAPHLGHAGHARVRHPAGRRVHRVRQPGELRVARAQGAGRASQGRRGVHQVGSPAADGPAARVRRRTTRGCCSPSARTSSAGSRSAGGSTGRARSAARSRSRPTSATRTGSTSACPGSAGSATRRGRWRASWSSGARRRRARWTVRRATSSPTTR